MLIVKRKGLDKAEKIQLRISYFLQLIIAATTIVLLVRQKWLTGFLVAGILILTFLPAIIQRSYKVYLPVEFELITIIFIFAAVFLGEYHSYYAKFWWWDTVLHTFSGFLLGIAGFLMVYILNEDPKIHMKMKLGFVSIFAFAFAVMLGAVWEIFEFSMDSLFGFSMQKNGLVDTMWDLIVDSIGALAIAILGFFYIKRRSKSLIFRRMIYRFVDKNPKLFKRK
jgi:hypothetical protein